MATAGGDSISSIAAEGWKRRADARQRKKQKQKQEEQQQAEKEGEGLKNPLDPRYSDYDPKQGKHVFTRFRNRNIDPDAESPAGPMRHTDRIFEEGFELSNLVNVVSVRIASSDYGYPFNVYGTVVARDSLDRQCVYLFRRDKDNSQLIRSKNDSLILTGPKRALMIYDSIFFEIDLKVTDVSGRKVKDERLSKGLMVVDGIFRLSFAPKHRVETEALVSMHSTLELNYTFIRNAVEGTVEVRILEGPVHFHGKILARTTNVPCDILLHDSNLTGVLTAGDNGVLQTARRVVGVSVDEMLLLTVAAAAGDVSTVEFTPRRNYYGEEEITCGNYVMLVKLTWSIAFFDVNF